MNRFLNEDNGLQMAFLDGNQPERLCEPLRAHIEARGGRVRLNAPVKVRLGQVKRVSGNLTWS
jgi:15-cis-phytoene desaturase